MPSAVISEFGEHSSLITILDLLRRGSPMTRPEIIATTGFGRRVVAQRIDDLMDAGLVAEGPPAPSTGGRPASTVSFRPDAGVVLVAEVSPSVVRAGYCDLGGRLVAWQQEAVTVSIGPEAILDLVQARWDEFLATLPLDDQPLMAIGIGVIGPVDTEHAGRSQVMTPYGWDGARVRDRLADHYGVPVWADNEVNMMALAEYRSSAGRERGDLILVLIDEGIGAGLVSNGRLHRGADGIAGELGHLTVSDDRSLLCWCGKTGCLTQVASTTAIERRLGAPIFGGPAGRASGDPAERAAFARDIAADAEATEYLRRAGESVGQILGDVVTIFNPSEIVLGGRVPSVGAAFLEPVERSLRRHSFPASSAELRVSVANHEDQLGLLGAGIMAIDGYLGWTFAGSWPRRRVGARDFR